MALVIDYKLTGSGWAECTISNGEQSCTITASYLADALGDLVLSANAMLRWFNNLSFSFEEEPGEFRWVFGGARNEIEVKILSFYDRDDEKPDGEGKVLFRTLCKREVFANAVHQAATRVLTEYGEAAYLEKWVEYPFPTEGLNELTRLLTPYADDLA